MARESFTHLDLTQRRQIENGLNQQDSLTGIARTVGVDASTVRREILRNRRDDGMSTSKGKDKNDCAFLKSCKVRGLCEDGCESRLCRRCHMPCQAICPEYAKRTCKTTERAPFVCNACGRYAHCTVNRFKYSAESADAASRRRARESRDGIDLTAEEMELLIENVREGLAKGQSVHHIFEAYEMPCSERSFYRYVEDESIPVLSIELAKKVKYKKRRRRKAVHEGGFYAGHEYDDFMELGDGERAVVTEVDTVLGCKRDHKCILSLHRADLHFQIYMLLGGKTKAAVVDALGWLEVCCGGTERFRELFGLMLLDRGSEFDDIDGMERSFKDPLQKRCACYFTDPSRPDQKGACEKNHVELRKVLPKGTSLRNMDAYTLAEICSHVNSTVRRGCGDATPFDLARLVFPQELFDNLGLRPIPAKDVVAAPNILYIPQGT
ncbi:MAG: IS30 family transposase [Eggerthella lenta]|nr:IS30 family transposase [Eggerthella lenta]